MHMKDAFWLAACNARPNQHLVNKNFRANVNLFFGNHIQRLYIKRILNDVQQAESRNGQLRRRNWSLKEEKFSSHSILRPSRSSDLRDKGRSTHCTACKADFSDYSGRWNMHTHRGLPTATVRLCNRLSGATLTPKRLRSLIKEKSIFISLSPWDVKWSSLSSRGLLH